ncbi:MAG: AAA family ATPase, partial [Lentilitoribacter sp.]
MTLKASTPVPTFTDPISLDIGAGESIVLIGANGAGKTRLGVFLDNNLTRSGTQVHRVAAHRSLSLNPKVTPPSFEIATKRLRLGNDNAREGQKNTFRFGSKPETVLLNDFDHLLGALYAENNDVSIRFRQSFIDGKANTDAPTLAKIDTLQAIWERVLPHRKLVVLGNNLKAKAAGADEYSASDMSDGERVIFYLIGQALLAQQHTLLIFDEPELHINKSILAKLWDEIEAARPDCAFLYITHDVEFARSRHAAKKYALRSYRKTPSEGWDIETIPDSESIPDDVVATII